MARDLLRELEEETGEWPEAWRPKEGEVLVATVKRYSTGQSAYGPVRTVIVERDDGSRVSLWLSSVMLLSLEEREQPQPGERIGLKYCGKHPVKGYKRYSLIVDREERAPSFEPLGGETDAPPLPMPPEAAPREGRTPPARTTDRPATPYAAATGLRPGAGFGPPPLGDDDDPFAER